MSESKVELVHTLFHGTGSSYGKMVHLTTFGQDNAWKKRLLARIEAPKRVLDLACGTGILTFEMARRWPDARITGVELRAEYLDEARAHAAAAGIGNVDFILSDAQDVRLEDRFDYITSCYIPKYVDLTVLVRNMAAMLAPGGWLLLQDFAYPADPGARDQWERHFVKLRELARTRYPDWGTMFDLLPDVIRKTRWIEDSTLQMGLNGLVDVEVETLGWGSAATVLGRKPPA